MKLYEHYKKKPYKYIGEAKHSETLEDVVIYETRYANELAKLWVRPKNLFFGTLESNGEKSPRFKKVDLEVKATAEITESDIQDIATVMEKAFGEWDPDWFQSTFKNHKTFFLPSARINDQVVAFKLGYESTSAEFYSWLGGVVPEFRGLGIAADLMILQHDWCREQGYSRILTKTQNRFRDMLLLNIKFGFDVIGFHASDEGGPKILLEKRL